MRPSTPSQPSMCRYSASCNYIQCRCERSSPTSVLGVSFGAGKVNLDLHQRSIYCFAIVCGDHKSMPDRPILHVSHPAYCLECQEPNVVFWRITMRSMRAWRGAAKEVSWLQSPHVFTTILDLAMLTYIKQPVGSLLQTIWREAGVALS
jgi:hypothetical protein